jgi:hypothetical protein
LQRKNRRSPRLAAETPGFREQFRAITGATACPRDADSEGVWHSDPSSLPFRCGISRHCGYFPEPATYPEKPAAGRLAPARASMALYSAWMMPATSVGDSSIVIDEYNDPR